MIYDPFVIPFISGIIIMTAVFIWQIYKWQRLLNKDERYLIIKGIFSIRIFPAFKEIFLEGLLHRRIFRINPVLGYMHMCFAFGWFMLILIGNLESRLYSGTDINPPYFPIFFRFFVNKDLKVPLNPFMEFLMDFLLLFVLSGVLLALYKRFYSGIFGMKRTFQRKVLDKFALASLWCVFPFRFLAESFTSATYHTGSFLTGTFGNLFTGVEHIQTLAYICWWAYSSVLFLFFVSMPFSRYMHIPAEVLLIALRQFGFKSQTVPSALSYAEVYSCSRCGLCLDSCQLNSAAHIRHIQAAHFIRAIREKTLAQEITENCLLCHRCREYCPVNIETSNLRISERIKITPDYSKPFDYLPITEKTTKSSVAYFAGCMTHLTPGIMKSMLKIFVLAGEQVTFIDENSGACCGRPQMLAGKMKSAAELIAFNMKLIEQSGAKTLVTSCPICYNVFKKEYKLNIKIVHHTTYINGLIQKGKIKTNYQDMKVVYHDPCELGRENEMYDDPREALRAVANVISIKNERGKSLCCGGSLGNTIIPSGRRIQIRKKVLEELLKEKPEILVTACPLCKKTLLPGTKTDVKDIAEVIVGSL